MKLNYLLGLMLLCGINASAQTISLTGGAATENFNTLATSGTANTTVPAGWFFVETGSGANTTYAADPGSATGGNTYSYGTGTNTDRALGGLQSGSVTPSIGAGFTNNTGSVITNLLISYTGEQWRLGALSRPDRIDFQYSTDATAINNGTWTDVNSLDFNAPVTTPVGALDGNAVANRTAISFTITGLNIAVGATVYIRWQSFDATGSDDGLAIDDFSITPGSGVTTSVSVATTTNAAEPSTNGLFTVTLTATSPTDVTILYNVGGTATAGTDYTALSGSVTVLANQLTATIPVSVLDDLTPEGVETVTVSLQSATAPYTIAVADASLNITSDDVATISFTGAYSQDFATLATTATSSTLPNGWVFNETGSNANTTYAASDGTGGSFSGNTYSFGTGISTDRAFGGVRSGSLIPIVGALFTNNTGATVTSLAITYTGEQWRLGTSGRNDRLDFQYSLNNNSITSGSFVNADGLDFIAPVGTGTVGGLDGNATGNRVTITYTIYGISIPNGSNFSIRWTDFDVTGAEDGLGIDDFSITLGCTSPTNQPTVLNLVPSLQSIAGSFTAAAAGTTPADGYLVLLSPSASLTELPTSGTAYAVDDVIGNATVVSIGSPTNFTANNLTPATTYYFYVFSSSVATNCYNVTAPLTGSIATNPPPACTAPTTQASALAVNNVTGVSADLSWTRGSGDNILVIAKAGSPVDAVIYNSIAYTTGTTIGSGNVVIYNGPAAAFAYGTLTQNTTYHLALYEYNNTLTCYLTPALTGSFTTLCTSPVNVSGLSASGANASSTISFTYPSAACSDEVIVVASTTPINTAGSTFTGPANATYTSGEQIVYRGTGSGVTVTGLTNGTLYYFKVFTRKGTDYSAGVQTTTTPFDPSSGYTYLYGNLHAHSSFSDGNKDNLSNTPDEDFAFARDALCMDFMGMSEHNHSGAGMSLPNYLIGYNEANSVNLVAGPGGHTLVTLWGMEWGTISGGGHVLVYGFDTDLLGWEPGNYNVLTPKSDYNSLWNTINSRSGAIATLAHPNTGDYTNLLGSAYSAAADQAIVGVAIESGPAFSTSINYNDFPSSLSYLSYYRGMLAKGYRLAPQMDQDNHNLTFGTANSNRMVVLATSKDRNGLMDGIRSMRYYASQDCNMRIDFKTGSNPMGSIVVNSGLPAINLSVTDLDAELTTQVELWGGPVGGTVPAAAIKTYNSGSFSFNSGDVENIQPNNSVWYYYVVVTQEDGNKAVTSPIWYTRNDLVLPLTLTKFAGLYNESLNRVELQWTTSQEINTKEFVIERSVNSTGNWAVIGKVDAAGNTSFIRQYQFNDLTPMPGNSLYRLKMVDMNGSYRYSPLVLIKIGQGETMYTVNPNPVHGTAYLRSSSSKVEMVKATLVDNTGKIIMRNSYYVGANAPASIDISKQTPGLYILRIEAAGKVYSEKVIIQ